MFLIFKKKRIVMILGILIIVCVFVINFSSSPDINVSNMEADISEDSPDLGDTVLVSADISKIETIKNNRELMRSKMCSLLTENIDNPNISLQAKSEMEKKLLLSAENMDKEIQCESMLALKGYENNVVFISDDMITVSVEFNELSEKDIAIIHDIILGQTGNNNIKIVEVK